MNSPSPPTPLSRKGHRGKVCSVATAHVVDACVRLKTPYRLAPAGIRPVLPLKGSLIGPALPVRHYGSVDVFLEALSHSPQAPDGAVMVIDNGGRTDEACIGDLVVLEAKLAGMAGMVVWGLHRDSRELCQLGLPVFSYGAYPSGPSRLERQEAGTFETAWFGDSEITVTDTVIADEDGAVFVDSADWPTIAEMAETIRQRETAQTQLALAGVTLREQFDFAAYLAQRHVQPEYTFRQHLSDRARSIEE